MCVRERRAAAQSLDSSCISFAEYVLDIATLFNGIGIEVITTYEKQSTQFDSIYCSGLSHFKCSSVWNGY